MDNLQGQIGRKWRLTLVVRAGPMVAGSGSGERLSPREDDEDGGVDEFVEELAASSGELSSRAASFPTVSLPSECWVPG